MAVEGELYIAIVVFGFLSALLLVHGVVVLWNKHVMPWRNTQDADAHEEMYNQDFVHRIK